MTTATHRRGFMASAVALSALAFASAPARAASPRPDPLSFAKTPRIEEIALAPDASKIAYVTQEAGQRVLVTIDLASGSAKKFPMGAYKLRGMFFVGPQHIVFTTSVTRPINITWSREELYQAHVFNLDSGKVLTLFDTLGYYDIVLGGFQVFKRNGKYTLSAANINKDTDAVTLFEFDLSRTTGDFLDGGREMTTDWVLGPEGQLMGRESVDSKNTEHRDWMLEMFIDGKWQEVYRKPVLTESPSLIGIGRDGKSLVVLMNEEGEGGLYHEIDAKGVLSEPLFDGDGTKSPRFHPQTRRLCGYAQSGDWPRYHYDDKVLAGVVTAVKDMIEPGERVRLIDFAEDPRKLIIYTEGPGNAGAYFYADFTTGDVIPILQNYPDIAAEWISDKKPIRFKAADGLEIPAYITYPPFKAPQKLPLVVMVHGGPMGARDTLAFEWETQVYASQGYAVLQVNYRGSGGYGWDYYAKGFGQYGRGMQTDLSDGVRHLATLGVVDPKRVAIVGASYGGYAALMGATVDRGIYRCAIDVAGVSDPKTFYLTTNLTNNPRYRYVTRMLGDGNLDEISPIKNVEKVDIPILIIHGEDDTVVTIEESHRMVSALKKAGKDVTFIKLKDEDHWQTTESGRIDMINASVAFLQKHNPA